MPLVVMQSGKAIAMPRDKCLAIWQVLVGEVEGTPAQQEFALKVKDVLMDYKTAPASWLERHPLAYGGEPYTDGQLRLAKT
jgi:hypothetical protein